jgi:putative phosphoesterase
MSPSTRIGILSDTHMPGSLREMWPEVGAAFAGVDLILHSGDICHPVVLDQLERWAPMIAARGNNDLFGPEDPRVADIQRLDIDGFRIAMVHDMEPEDEPIEDLQRKYLRGVEADVMITGHTLRASGLAGGGPAGQFGQCRTPASVVHPAWDRRHPGDRARRPAGED